MVAAGAKLGQPEELWFDYEYQVFAKAADQLTPRPRVPRVRTDETGFASRGVQYPGSAEAVRIKCAFGVIWRLLVVRDRRT